MPLCFAFMTAAVVGAAVDCIGVKACYNESQGQSEVRDPELHKCLAFTNQWSVYGVHFFFF